MTLRNDEKIGLGAAVLLHGALVGVLALQTMRSEVSVFPERINVSLATDVGLEAAAPDPVSESRMASAPTLDINPAPAPEPAKPEPATRTAQTPPKPTTKTAAQQPAPSRDRSRPDRTPPKQATTPPRQTAPKTGGGPSFDEAFRDGAGTSRNTDEARAPAPKYGPSELASLDSAIGRQVKVKWQGRVPQGPDAEKLVTRVRFKLNADGTLAGEPQVVDTVGVTDLNRNQVARHREEAVRAVKLVGKFNVPFPVPGDHNTFTLKFERNR
ncbi:energy transducer TonB [Erythrobacter colymbi]|uniref:energy transducer TonB n=1 Tax=Erythrobacter colymbi TaxID=1161202 RepID=UPI00117BE4FA|nr:energy transducer TonB [Erythrobacter colymbi]